ARGQNLRGFLRYRAAKDVMPHLGHVVAGPAASAVGRLGLAAAGHALCAPADVQLAIASPSTHGMVGYEFAGVWAEAAESRVNDPAREAEARRRRGRGWEAPHQCGGR